MGVRFPRAPQRMKKKKKPEIVIVAADDWEGLYIDGKLFKDDHVVSVGDLVKAGLIDVSFKEASIADGERFPLTLDELRLDDKE